MTLYTPGTPRPSSSLWLFQLDDEPNLYMGNGWKSPFLSITWQFCCCLGMGPELKGEGEIVTSNIWGMKFGHDLNHPQLIFMVNVGIYLIIWERRGYLSFRETWQVWALFVERIFRTPPRKKSSKRCPGN